MMVGRYTQLLMLLCLGLLACQPQEEVAFDPADVPTLAPFNTWTPTSTHTPSITPSATLSPTATASPTPITPTDTLTATATLTASQTPSVTATLTATPIIGLAYSDAEIAVYRGPGREFEMAQLLDSGSFVTILSSVSNDAGEIWYYVRLENTVEAWLSSEVLLYEEGSAIAVQEIAAVVSRTPTPSLTPSNTFTATRTPSNTPTLTLTPSATFTRTFTPTITPTATRTFTHTPTPTATIPAEADGRINTLQNINLRSGPGEDFAVLGALAVGEYVALIGRNENATWYQAATFDLNPRVGWVLATFVDSALTADDLPLTWFGEGTAAEPISCGVNFDPFLEGSSRSAIEETALVQWVRLPFVANLDEFVTLGDALSYYDSIINIYGRNQIQVMLVLDLASLTREYDFSWAAMTNPADWEAFLTAFLPILERVTQHFTNRVGAYQIFDRLTNAGQALVPAADYARILTPAARLINAYTPQTLVVTGGIDPQAENYLRELKNDLGGEFAADGVGVYAYGYGIGDDNAGGQLGEMGQFINRLVQIVPGTPLWLTEFGPANTGATRAEVPTLRLYITDLLEFLQLRYPLLIKGLFWSPWSATGQKEPTLTVYPLNESPELQRHWAAECAQIQSP